MDEQQESVSEDRDQDEAGVAGEEADDALEDVITGRLIKGSPKEEVRQRIAQALEHEYGLSRADMAPDFPVPVETDGQRRSRRVEIAIFAGGRPHELENLRRVVMCRPEPKNGAKSVTKIRDHEQARDELDQLWRLMQAVPGCRPRRVCRSDVRTARSTSYQLPCSGSSKLWITVQESGALSRRCAITSRSTWFCGSPMGTTRAIAAGASRYVRFVVAHAVDEMGARVFKLRQRGPGRSAGCRRCPARFRW